MSNAVLIAIVVILAAGMLSSPVWLSLVVWLSSRWSFRPVATTLVCAFQATIVYALWWLFWGGGIGGEAHINPSWQWLGLGGLAPPVTAVVREIRTRPRIVVH